MSIRSEVLHTNSYQRQSDDMKKKVILGRIGHIIEAETNSQKTTESYGINVSTKLKTVSPINGTKTDILEDKDACYKMPLGRNSTLSNITYFKKKQKRDNHNRKRSSRSESQFNIMHICISVPK